MNQEEIIKAIDENEEIRQGVLGHVNKSEWGKEFIENTGKSYFEQNRDKLISPVVKEVHDAYDKDYKELFGEDKPEGVKTYEAYKQKIQSLKDGGASKSEIEKLKKEADEWKNKAENNESVKHYKELYEQTNQKFQTREQELQKELEETKTQAQQSMVKNEFSSALSQFKLNDSLNENLKNDTINRIISNLATNSNVTDGITVFKDGDGKTILNDLNAPITAKELLERELKRYELLDEGSKKPGGGSDGTKTSSINKTDDGKEALVLDATNVKTKTELTKAIDDALNKEGIPLYSKRGNELRDEAYKRLGEGLTLT